MKRIAVALFVLAFMVAGVSAFADVMAPAKVDITLFAGYPVSDLVTPSATLTSFLSDHGVNLKADKATIDKEIGMLSSTVTEDPITGEKYLLGRTLDEMVNSDLVAAHQQTGDPVNYMTLGTYRWAIAYEN